MEHLHSLGMIGTYVPRRCGIATFTADLTHSLQKEYPGTPVRVIAMNDKPEGYPYPKEVRFEIDQNRVQDYRLAADFLNFNQVEVLCLQHEYGIFGGATGNYILQLLRELRMPIVTTLHTILKSPTREQQKVLQEIAYLSDALVVMSGKGVEFCTSIYNIPKEKIVQIPHGIPDLPFVDPTFYKDKFGVEGKCVLLTFGLLSPNKGIEYMIQALPQIVARVPNVVYIILGATHPHIVKTQGQAYRQSLERLARSLGVDKHVVFYNQFVELDELCEFLAACDIYVTPYLAEEQIVSGTLSYALGAGKATVSTPYWYATEMLAEERGILVPFRDASALAREILRLLENESERNAMRKRAYLHMRQAVWTQVAHRYMEVFRSVRTDRVLQGRTVFQVKTLEEKTPSVPELKFQHLFGMTDHIGLFQHAKYTIPDYQHGYTTDDNARALLAMVLAHFLNPRPQFLRYLKRYLAFLRYAYNPETRTFRNFLSFSRQWLEQTGSEDCQGRAIWALGATAGLSSVEDITAPSIELFYESLPILNRLMEQSHPRAISFALIGLNAYLYRFGGDSTVRRYREQLASHLADLLGHGMEPGWNWFADSPVTYANAKIPQALLLSGHSQQQPEWIELGIRVLDWLIELQTQDGRFSPIGNRGWYTKDGTRARFDQQPIEAQGMVEVCLLAHRITGKSHYLETAHRAFNWFFGQNDLGEILYDYSNGGCRDGLTPDGPNLNQGAESTLACLLSNLMMEGYKSEQYGIFFLREEQP
ncbi:MAG: glycosyltransferase family 4 protein [Spirochaetales bacterium]